MSSYPEVGERSLGEVHGNSPDEVRRAGLTVVEYCVANQLPPDAMVELLQMAGVVPTEPSAAKTSPVGRNVTPAMQEQRRQATAARRRAARAAAKQKREAS